MPRKRRVPKKPSKKKSWIKIERKPGETTPTVTTSDDVVKSKKQTPTNGMNVFFGGLTKDKTPEERQKMGQELFNATQDYE